MINKEKFKKNFVKVFHQTMNLCKETVQESDNQYNQGRNDAFDDVLLWYNKISDNGNKLVTVNEIILYIQEKIEKTKTNLNVENSEMLEEDGSDLGRLFSFPQYN